LAVAASSKGDNKLGLLNLIYFSPFVIFGTLKTIYLPAFFYFSIRIPVSFNLIQIEPVVKQKIYFLSMFLDWEAVPIHSFPTLRLYEIKFSLETT
jgi:hypothetical protein